MDTQTLLSTILESLAEDVARRAARRADGEAAELQARVKELEESIEAFEDDDLSPMRQRIDELEDLVCRLRDEREDLDARIVEVLRREAGRIGRLVGESLYQLPQVLL